MTFFLPILSDTYPENNEPTAAPTKAIDTTAAICYVEMLGHVSSKYNYAPAIALVSYPNRNPPIAATLVS